MYCRDSVGVQISASTPETGSVFLNIPPMLALGPHGLPQGCPAGPWTSLNQPLSVQQRQCWCPYLSLYSRDRICILKYCTYVSPWTPWNAVGVPAGTVYKCTAETVLVSWTPLKSAPKCTAETLLMSISQPLLRRPELYSQISP